MSRFEQWTDTQLVEYAARCWRDKERLERDIGACDDSAMDAIQELERRHAPNIRGEIVAASLQQWLADDEAQDDHQDWLDLHERARRLFDEMGKDPS